MQICQSPDESFRDYLKRFRDTVSLMKKLNVAQAIAHLVQGLNLQTSKDLMKDIIAKEPTKLGDIYKLTEQHITIDKAFRALNLYHNDRKHNREDDKGPTNARGKFKGKPHDSITYTSLNSDRTEILHEIKNKPFFEKPPKMFPGAKRRTDKYCLYHKDNGHDTKDCRQLKAFLEKHVKKGNLEQFLIRKDSSAGPSHTNPDKRVVSVVMTTNPTQEERHTRKNSTHSVFHISSPEPKRQKVSPNNVITLSDEDYHQATTSSDDALVVTLDIANQNVQRILIDKGSSVDILYNHAL